MSVRGPLQEVKESYSLIPPEATPPGGFLGHKPLYHHCLTPGGLRSEGNGALGVWDGGKDLCFVSVPSCTRVGSGTDRCPVKGFGFRVEKEG